MSFPLDCGGWLISVPSAQISLCISFNQNGRRGLERKRDRNGSSENNAISGEALFNLLQVDGGSPIASSGLISNPHELSISAHLPLDLWNGPQIACLGWTWWKVHSLASCFPSLALSPFRWDIHILYYSQKDWMEIEGIKPCHLISLPNELHGTDSILKMWAAVWFKRNEADYSKPSTRIWLVSTDKLSNKLWLKHFMISINKSGGFILVESFYVSKQISINSVAGQGCNIYIHYTSEVSQCFVFQPMSMRKSPKAMNLCVVNQSPTCEYYHRFNAHEIPQVREGPVYFPP